MTIINTNSISGINSITAQGASGVAFYDSSGSSQRLRITSAGLVDISGGIQVSENVTPTSGEGVEIFAPSSGTGQIQSFDRTNNNFDKLIIKGDPVEIYDGSTKKFETTSVGLTIHEDTDKTISFTGGIGEIGNVTGFQALNTAGSALVDFGMRANTLRFATGNEERLRISSSGKIGIGIDDPQVKLHVQDSAASKAYFSHPTSNKTTLYIESDDSSARVGSTYLSGGSAFKPLDFLTSGETRVRINPNGRFDVGDELGVEHCGIFQAIYTGGTALADDCMSFFETNSDDWIMKLNFNKASSSHYHIDFMEQGTRRGTISGADGSNVAFTPGSDYRMKENIIDLTDTDGINLVKNLKPRKYNWIDNRKNTGEINTVNGFVAHEVEEAGLGHLVYGNGKDAVNEDGSIDPQTLDYAGITPVLAAAVKGLISKVEDLEQRLSAAGIS